MEKLRSLRFCLFGLLVAACLLFFTGTGEAREPGNGDDPISFYSEMNSEVADRNIKTAGTLSKANFVLNWAEYKFPLLFPPGPVTQYSLNPDVFYRTYPTGFILGAYLDHLYLVDQQSQLIDCGPLDWWVDYALETNAGEVFLGYVYSSVSVDRKPGMGDCGAGPWSDPYCSTLKIWWKMKVEGSALTPVVIIPDGENRWVITNMVSVGEKYGVTLPASNNLGKFQSMLMDPSVTNPECIVTQFSGADFSFQVMGTRENGMTELILSANPVEATQGRCMQTSFAYETTCLLNGWAAGLSGDPIDLRVELNDTFMVIPGQYTFVRTTDTNPSPENRDHVRAELDFFCTDSIQSGVQPQNIPCPWE